MFNSERWVMIKDFKMKNSFERIVEETDVVDLKNGFIETLTHDIKTPILAQIRALELLIEEHFGQVSDEQSEILKLTLDSCQYMYEMVSTLISTYRYDNEDFKLNYSYFNFASIVEESIANISRILRKENIKAVIVNRIKTPLISADAIRIQKVIHTLLLNSINIAMKNTILRITMKESTGFITILIESHGAYINSERMKKMFDIYTYNTEKYNKIGCGVGLYLVKKIIEKHNGKIIAKSEIPQENILGFKIPINNIQYLEKCV